MAALRAGAALPLTSRYAPFAGQAAHGLECWAAESAVALEIVDCGESPGDAAVAAMALAARSDILFGPYGSGAMRAVAAAFAGSPAVIWNHGGSATERTGARVVDVLGPATTYWTGLPAIAGPDARVAILHAPSGFGREVAAGAVSALRAAGIVPLVAGGFDASTASAAGLAAVRDGVDLVVGCGRFEDDVALVRAVGPTGTRLALVAAGVAEAAETLGDAIVGVVGPSQWDPSEGALPQGLSAGDGYPAVQAYAAGQLAVQAIEQAGSTEPDAVWQAALALRARTVLGPFAVDAEGRQVAHRPVLVQWVAGPGGPRREVVWRPEGGS